MNIVRDQTNAGVKRDESVLKQKELEGKSDCEQLDQNTSTTQYDDKFVKLSAMPTTMKLCDLNKKIECPDERCYTKVNTW